MGVFLAPTHVAMVTASTSGYLARTWWDLRKRCLKRPAWSVVRVTVRTSNLGYCIIDWIGSTWSWIAVKPLFAFRNTLFLPPFSASVLKPNLCKPNERWTFNLAMMEFYFNRIQLSKLFSSSHITDHKFYIYLLPLLNFRKKISRYLPPCWNYSELQKGLLRHSLRMVRLFYSCFNLAFISPWSEQGKYSNDKNDAKDYGSKEIPQSLHCTLSAMKLSVYLLHLCEGVMIRSMLCQRQNHWLRVDNLTGNTNLVLLRTCTLASLRSSLIASSSLMNTSGYCVFSNALSNWCSWYVVNVVRLLLIFLGFSSLSVLFTNDSSSLHELLVSSMFFVSDVAWSSLSPHSSLSESATKHLISK